MSQEQVGPLQESVGYALKRASAGLRSSMDAVLRPLKLTVPQYSCLEVLDQQPGLSGAELARATFVTRQSMTQLLQGLAQRGLITRAASVEHGRALPTELTDAGRRQLRSASTVVRHIEEQMLAALSESAQHRLHGDLIACTTALSNHTT